VDFDTKVKLNIYEMIAANARTPTVSDIAQALGCLPYEVEEAFERLYQKRLLVLQPGTFDIRMAPPFSGIETPFRVLIEGKTYFANCAWDALGVAAALHKDADIDTVCAQSGEAMRFQIRGGTPLPEACVIHFAVPAAHWWDNIIYT
jgi:hypothetical protein